MIPESSNEAMSINKILIAAGLAELHHNVGQTVETNLQTNVEPIMGKLKQLQNPKKVTVKRGKSTRTGEADIEEIARLIDKYKSESEEKTQQHLVLNQTFSGLYNNLGWHLEGAEPLEEAGANTDDGRTQKSLSERLFRVLGLEWVIRIIENLM